MPKASTIQGNFSAGEVSPLLNGRVDSPRYKQALDTGFNYIPTLQGPLVRRPGTKNLNEVKDSTNPPVLITFQFSITQAYVLEFGVGYVRFYTKDSNSIIGQVVTTATSYKLTGSVGSNDFTPTYDRGLTMTACRPDKNPLLGERIYGSTTVTAGSPLEVNTPFSADDLANLRWAQDADTLYLFCPARPPQKLKRYSQYSWSLEQVFFQDGPYLPYDSVNNIGDYAGVELAVMGASPTPSVVELGIQATAKTLSNATNQGGLILLTTSTAHGYVSGMRVYVQGGTLEAQNSGMSSWQISVVSSTSFTLNGSSYVNPYLGGGSVWPAPFQTTDFSRTFCVIFGGARWWGTIGTITNPTHVQLILAPGQPLFNGGVGSAVTAWAFGKYSYNNYPVCGAFHQSRLVMSGCANQPQELDFSVVGSYENMALSPPSGTSALQPNASSAMQFQLNSAEHNAIMWLKSTAQALLAGSYVAEWAISPSSTSDALTVFNFNAAQTSSFGSANADAVSLGNSVLYIQRAKRKVRELHYFFQVGTFRSTDMTELSEHITLPSITKILVQKETQPLVWALRSDGALVSMIYDRNDANVQAGWTRHQLGGYSDNSGTPPIVLSMAVIPSTDISFDQVWLVVKRWINGAQVVMIEYMTKIFDDLALQEDAFQLDCGGTYDAPITITGVSIANPCVVSATAHGFSNGQRIRISGVSGLGLTTYDANGNPTTTNLVNNTTFMTANVTTNTFSLTDYLGNPVSSIGYGVYISGGQVRALVTNITGITWLKNETISVLADGGIHPNVTVSNSGGITLNYPAAKVQVGYGFKSQGKLLRVEGGAADGSSIGKTRRTSRAAFMLHNIGDLSVGTSFDRLIPIKFPQGDNQLADQATPLFSGIKREGLESAYDFDSQICFEQSSPLPGVIQAITSFMEEQDV